MKPERYSEAVEYLHTNKLPDRLTTKSQCNNFKRDMKKYRLHENKLQYYHSEKGEPERVLTSLGTTIDPTLWQEGVHYYDILTKVETWLNVIQDLEIDEIVKQLHRETGCGGRDKIVWLFRQCYYYWGLETIVNKHRLCDFCQQLKAGVRETSCKPILTKYPLEHLVIDYTFYNTHPIFVAIDSFSKYIWMWLTNSKEPCHVVKYLKLIALETGLIPTVVRADNGGEFKAHEVHDLVEREWGSKFIHGSPAHPQTQGVVERPNKTLKDLIDVELRAQSGMLSAKIEQVRAIYNQRVHSTINMTPASAFEKTKYMHPKYKRNNDEAQQLGTASITAETILKRTTRRAERNQRAHDKRKDPAHMIKVGDIVFHQNSRKQGMKRLRGLELNTHCFRGEVVERALNNTIRIKWLNDVGGPTIDENEGEISKFYPVSHFYKPRTSSSHETEKETKTEVVNTEEDQPEKNPETDTDEHSETQPQEQSKVRLNGITPVRSRKTHKRPVKRRRLATSDGEQQ